MQEPDGIFFCSARSTWGGGKENLAKEYSVWLIRSTRRLELMKDESLSFEFFVIFMMYHNPVILMLFCLTNVRGMAQ